MTRTSRQQLIRGHLLGWWMVLISPTLTAAATVYYVDAGHPLAADANTGTRAEPWRTIQHALDRLQPGETVYIRDGVYAEGLQTVRSGDLESGPVTVAAFPGHRPVVDGTGVATAATGFTIRHDHIHVQGLVIRHWDTGIWLEGAGHTRLDDCEVHQAAFGIGAADGTHDFELNRVIIHHFDLYGFDASPSGGAPCYYGTLNDCLAHTGRDPEQNVDGFALGHGTQYGFVLNRCRTWGVFDGFDISARGTRLERCVAHDCTWGGFKIWQDDVRLVNCLAHDNQVVNVELDWDEEPGVVRLINCTLVDGATWNVYAENAGDTLQLANCLLAGGDNIGLLLTEHVAAGTYAGDFNLFHCGNSARVIVDNYEFEFSGEDIAAGLWHTYSGQDGHSATAATVVEIFSGGTATNFRPGPGSPAVDAGTADGAPPRDMDGRRRAQGAAVDIGCFEYHAPPGRWGDADGDGYVTSFDRLNLARFLAGNMARLTDAAAADIDADGRVSLPDLIRLHDRLR
ncbi:MAG: right-handed parallel beta-helix repeat-containing protein [Acidobacteria bacterium]|nr:right-handed parallel beta-helix repeat-containing protein [Acidobacteriota bacterium]